MAWGGITLPGLVCFAWLCSVGGVNYDQKELDSEISDITKNYLRKIDSLCRAQNIQFYLLPAPVEDTLESYQQMERIETEFEERGLNQIFPDYFEQIQYYPEKEFGDHTHFPVYMQNVPV